MAAVTHNRLLELAAFAHASVTSHAFVLEGFVPVRKLPDLRDALYFVGTSYYNMNDKTKAAGIFKKILTMTPESESIYQKTRKLLKQIEGNP